MRPSYNKQETFAHITPPGAPPLNLPSLREIVGVTNQSLNKWITACEEQLTSIDEAGRAIMARKFRENIIKLTGVIKDIISNCKHDPDDIREEIALPTILERLAATIDEYVDTASHRVDNEVVHERMQESERVIERSITFLTKLLDTMKSNDAKDAFVRSEVLSRIFINQPSTEQAPVFVEVEGDQTN